MATLHFPPAATGYSAQQRSGVLSVELDGGASRYRKDILHGAFRVTATWFCNRQEYDYLCAFHRTSTQSGSLPFDVSLRLDAEKRAVHTAYFVPGTFRLSRMEGRSRVVEAELEVVKPFDSNEATADAAIITAYETSRGITA